MSENPTNEPAMDHAAILDIAPHRYPFLMVDRVLEVKDEGATIIGVKNVSFNEPWAMGHFPEHPVFPGVLQVEAMAQVGGILIIGRPENKGKLGLLMSVDKSKFRRPVHPGDQLIIEATVVKERRSIYEIECKCLVDDKVVSQANIKFAIADKQ